MIASVFILNNSLMITYVSFIEFTQ